MFNRIFRNTKRWLINNSNNALEQAYQQALKIQDIEKEYFQGQKISIQNCEYSDSVFAYFQSQLNSNLQSITIKLNQFRTNQSISNFLTNDSTKSNQERNYYNNGQESNGDRRLIIERLEFIDSIIDKYEQNNQQLLSSIVTSKRDKYKQIKSVNNLAQNESKNDNSSLKTEQIEVDNSENEPKLETISDKTSILPRSFLRTLGKIRQGIDPQSAETEEEVVNKFRKSRYKTAISTKFLLLLIIIPLLVHNLSKIAIGQIFVEPYFEHHQQILFINQDLQEEALVELKAFEENLSLKAMIGLIPHLSTEEKEDKIKEKAEELAEDYRHRSANAVENIFADILSIVAFGIIVLTSKKELSILKSFIDELIYGLSDSAKAFLIILFTDMFVGFHSPHGWEIILESITRHFGLSENREFNFLFIATFPVILDTVLKYWIFRYLNRISPSAVATYKNMNES